MLSFRRTCNAGRTSSASLLFFAVLLTELSAPAHASRPDSVPDWVKAAIAQPLPPYSAETSAVVLLNEVTLSIGADGRAVRHTRYVVKILRAKGRDEGIVHVPFNDDSKILALHVWSVGPDGHEYATKDNELVEVGYPNSGSMYEDERFKAALPPGRDPGGVVAYECEQRVPPYMHEETFFFQDDVPRLRQSLTLELPPGYTYQSAFAHHAAVRAIDLEHQRTRWELENVPGIDLDRVPFAPPMAGLMGRMVVHFAPANASSAPLGSWQAVGDLYDQISHDRMAANPEIAAKAAELTAGKTDFYDKTEAIAEFVQKEIRYFVIEKGIGGYQPHPAAEIFHNRYGDCKDKATLLAAMLSSVGVHSAILLVDTERGFVDPETPSMLGNHAIGAIEVPAGYDSPRLRSVVTAKSGKRYLIVDPTWEKTAYGQLEHNLQGGYGLLVEGKTSEVIRIPVLTPDRNTVNRSATMHLQPDGSVKGAITEKRFGDLSDDTRYLYTHGDHKQQEEIMNRSLNRDFTSFNVSNVKVADATALNKDVVTSFDITADHFGRSMGALLMVRPRVYGSEGMELDRKPRKVPIDLEETRQEKDDFTIQLPEGYTIDELPEPVKLDVGFASYESSSTLNGSSLHYTRTYTVREVSLPPERYADVQKLAAAIDLDEQSHAVLKKK